MAAGSYSFTIERGSTVDFEVRYQDSDKAPIALNGQYAEMRIRNSYGGNVITELTSSLEPGASYTKSSGSAFLSISGSDLSTSVYSGSIGIYIGHEVTSTFNFDRALYDIELTNGAARTRLIQGRVKLSKDVT